MRHAPDALEITRDLKVEVDGDRTVEGQGRSGHSRHGSICYGRCTRHSRQFYPIKKPIHPVLSHLRLVEIVPLVIVCSKRVYLT